MQCTKFPICHLNNLNTAKSHQNSCTFQSFDHTHRAATAGLIPLPLHTKVNTFVWHAATLKTGSKALREASTKGEAMTVAKSLAKKAPI